MRKLHFVVPLICMLSSSAGAAEISVIQGNPDSCKNAVRKIFDIPNYTYMKELTNGGYMVDIHPPRDKYGLITQTISIVCQAQGKSKDGFTLKVAVSDFKQPSGPFLDNPSESRRISLLIGDALQSKGSQSTSLSAASQPSASSASTSSATAQTTSSPAKPAQAKPALPFSLRKENQGILPTSLFVKTMELYSVDTKGTLVMSSVGSGVTISMTGDGRLNQDGKRYVYDVTIRAINHTQCNTVLTITLFHNTTPVHLFTGFGDVTLGPSLSSTGITEWKTRFSMSSELRDINAYTLKYQGYHSDCK